MIRCWRQRLFNTGRYQNTLKTIAVGKRALTKNMQIRNGFERCFNINIVRHSPHVSVADPNGSSLSSFTNNKNLYSVSDPAFINLNSDKVERRIRMYVLYGICYVSLVWGWKFLSWQLPISCIPCSVRLRNPVSLNLKILSLVTKSSHLEKQWRLLGNFSQGRGLY